MSDTSETSRFGRRSLMYKAAGLAVAAAVVPTVASAATSRTAPGSERDPRAWPPHQVINPAGIAAPYGYSHGISVQPRQVVLLAGEVGQNKDGGWAVGTVAQYEQTLRNLLRIVQAAGGKPHNLVSLTAFIVDMDDFQAHYNDMLAIWRRLVGPDYPAMSVIGVNRLWFPESLMEIQGVAVLFD